MTRQHEPWPPYCCVAAFADAALHQLGARRPPRSNLARLLNTHVLKGSENPWSLPVVSDRHLAGVPPTLAVRAINNLLSELAPSLRMRHIPFKTIAMQLYADLADDSIRRGVVTGLGLDWTTASGEGDGLHRHLLRLSRASARGATLLDDSISEDAELFDMSWGVIERSVNVVGDGFWLVGPVEKLSFEIADPWKGSESS